MHKDRVVCLKGGKEVKFKFLVSTNHYQIMQWQKEQIFPAQVVSSGWTVTANKLLLNSFDLLIAVPREL